LKCFFILHVISAGGRDIETWRSPPIHSIFRSLPGRTGILVFFFRHFGYDEVLKSELCNVGRNVKEVQCCARVVKFAKGKLDFWVYVHRGFYSRLKAGT